MDNGEFGGDRGEQQRQGARRSLGLPLSPSSQVTAASDASLADLAQVETVYSARPIGAQDFAFEVSQTIFGDDSVGTTEFDQSFALPPLYTAVLEKVEFEFIPPFLGGTDATGAATGPRLQFFIKRDGLALPNNTVTLRGGYADYTWDTYQVFAAWQTMGVGGFFLDGLPAPPSGDRVYVTARMFGTLIPTRGLAPVKDVGSIPPIVRVRGEKP